jgi:hypothetical protein
VASVCASSKTRRPSSASCAARLRAASPAAPEAWAPTISGAPSTHDPRSLKRAALHFRAEEKGTASSIVQSAGAGSDAPMASRVELRPEAVAAIAPKASSARASRPRSPPSPELSPGPRAPKGSKRSKAGWGSVMVPVLSIHSTSTRAKPSTAGNSRVRTLRRASVIADTAKAMLVSSTNPCGTIATNAATVLVTPSAMVAPMRNCAHTRSAPTGMIAVPTTRRMLLMPFTRSECRRT